MSATIALFASVAIALALYRFYPEWTRRQFDRIASARKALWALFLVAFAATLLASGSLTAMLGGAAIFGYGVLYYLFEQPFDPITERLGI
jgi:hypothetical protein